MCNKLTPLASSNDYRQIFRCEHGTIHLNWDLVTMYLDEPTLGQLLRVLEMGQSLTDPGHVQDGVCFVFYHKKDYFQIWIRNAAINVSPAEFKILTDLVQTASQNLQNSPRSAPKKLDDEINHFYRLGKAAPSQHFSLN